MMATGSTVGCHVLIRTSTAGGTASRTAAAACFDTRSFKISIDQRWFGDSRRDSVGLILS